MRTWKIDGPPEIVAGNRHVGHHLLVAPAGEPGEECAGALDAVLRIAGQPNDGVVDAFGTKIGALGSASRRDGFGRARIRIHAAG